MTRLVQIIANDPKSKSTTYLADDGNTYVLKGDLSARTNNPGNISPTGPTARGHYETNFGAIGYLPSSNGPPVAVFPDFETGQAAQVYLWQTPAYQKKTLGQAARSWAASPYVGALVAAAGVPEDTLVSDLTPEQLNAVVSAQVGQEGDRGLTITDTNGNPVPLDLAGQLGAVRLPPGSIGLDAAPGAAGAAGPAIPLPAPAPLTPESMPPAQSSPPSMPRPRPEPPKALDLVDFLKGRADIKMGVDSPAARQVTSTLGWKDGAPDKASTISRNTILSADEMGAAGASTLDRGLGAMSDPRTDALLAPRVTANSSGSPDDRGGDLVDILRQRAEGKIAAAASAADGATAAGGAQLEQSPAIMRTVSQAQNEPLPPGVRPNVPTLPPTYEPDMLGRGIPAQPVVVAPTPQPYPVAADPQVAQQVAPQPRQDPSGNPVAAPPQQFLRLPSGKSIAAGNYPSSDGHHRVQVTDDGNGNAVVTKVLNLGEIPGVVDPMREANSNTLAGGLIRKYGPEVFSKAFDSAKAGLGEAVDNVKQTASDAVNNLGQGTQQLGSDIGNAFSGISASFGSMFGGNPVVAPVNSSGSPDDRDAPRAVAPVKPVAPMQAVAQNVTKSVVNPDWTAWDKKYGSGAAGTGGANDTLMDIHDRRDDATVNAQRSAPKAPPKTIKITTRVPVIAPTPMPGRPASANAVIAPDPVQQMFLATPIGKALNAMNGGTLGTYRAPGVSPEVHRQLMEQQSDDQRGQAAMRQSGMLDQFGMTTF